MSDPIFIVGAQRSGTTMFRLMLDAHSRIGIPFETNFLVEYAERRDELGDLADEAARRRLVQAIQAEDFVSRGELAALDPAEVAARSGPSLEGVVDALFSLWAEGCGKARWGDKSPGASRVDVLHELFPTAAILHVIRDARDVVTSRSRTWKEGSIERLARDWVEKVSTVRDLGSKLGALYHEVRFEDLVSSPREVLEGVCEFLGEEFEPGMLDYHRTARDRLPARSVEVHHQTSIRPPDPSKAGMWRRNLGRGERVIVQRVAGDLLASLGYELEDHDTLLFRIAGWFVDRRDRPGDEAGNG